MALPSSLLGASLGPGGRQRRLGWGASCSAGPGGGWCPWPCPRRIQDLSLAAPWPGALPGNPGSSLHAQCLSLGSRSPGSGLCPPGSGVQQGGHCGPAADWAPRPLGQRGGQRTFSAASKASVLILSAAALAEGPPSSGSLGPPLLLGVPSPFPPLASFPMWPPGGRSALCWPGARCWDQPQPKTDSCEPKVWEKSVKRTPGKVSVIILGRTWTFPWILKWLPLLISGVFRSRRAGPGASAAPGGGPGAGGASRAPWGFIPGVGGAFRV